MLAREDMFKENILIYVKSYNRGGIFFLLLSIIRLEKNTGKTFSDINCSNAPLGQSPKATETRVKINKSEDKQTRPNEIYKILHSKGNHK